MSLDLIPPELIREILSQVELHNPHSREGLRHLSKSSSRYHFLVQPFLYSFLIESGIHDIPLFLRSILANPSLADYTRELKSSAFTAPFAYNFTSVLSHSQRARLEESIYAACDNDGIMAGDWIDAIFNRINNYDAVIAITICLMSNLESIQIDGYGLPGGTLYVEHVFKRAAMLQQKSASVLPFRLEKLSRVSLSYHDQQEPELDFNKGLCFIRPPSVQSFFCKGLASDAGSGMNFKSSVREITFDSFVVLDLTVSHILHHCVALRSFKSTDYRPLRLPFLAFRLENSRESLEEVVLQDDGRYWSNPRHLSRCNRSDWSKFGRLVHLDISWHSLIQPLQVADEGHTNDDESEIQAQHQEITKKFLQRLPPSLKFLRMFLCDRPSISPLVKALVMGKEIHTPFLEEVVLETKLEWPTGRDLKEYKGYEVWEQKLVDLCKSFEVRLEITSGF